MFLMAYNYWFRRAAISAIIAFALCAIAISEKPAEAAFVGVGVGIPGYYPPGPVCAYYYPYGCYGYPGSYYAPAGAVVGGWGWGGWGWGGPWWRDGRLYRDGRFFTRDGRFFTRDGRFFARDGRFFVGDGRV